MTILRTKVTWSRGPLALPPLRPTLTATERTNARAAIRQLWRRFGSWTALAAVMGVRADTLRRLGVGDRAFAAAYALAAARVAGVHVEAILTGEWPRPGACPHCGRAG